MSADEALLPDSPDPPALPNLLDARCVLCVQPHYDDNDIGAGGTIAALHDRGRPAHLHVNLDPRV